MSRPSHHFIIDSRVLEDLTAEAKQTLLEELGNTNPTITVLVMGDKDNVSTEIMSQLGAAFSHYNGIKTATVLAETLHDLFDHVKAGYQFYIGLFAGHRSVLLSRAITEAWKNNATTTRAHRRALMSFPGLLHKTLNNCVRLPIYMASLKLETAYLGIVRSRPDTPSRVVMNLSETLGAACDAEIDQPKPSQSILFKWCAIKITSEVAQVAGDPSDVTLHAPIEQATTWPTKHRQRRGAMAGISRLDPSLFANAIGADADSSGPVPSTSKASTPDADIQGGSIAEPLCLRRAPGMHHLGGVFAQVKPSVQTVDRPGEQEGDTFDESSIMRI